MSFSASFNKVGPRIAIVGNVNEPDIWENSRAFFDLQVTKSFLKHRLELKLNAQNLLARRQIFYQNRNLEESSGKGIKGMTNKITSGDAHNENGYSSREDDLIWSTNYGKVISASISFKF